MPRPVSNPPNPWASRHVEWLEAPPAVALQVYEESSRSILSTNDSPDIPFRYSLNPYRGCQHACAYCYARSTHQYIDFGAGTDFDSKIVVKTNAAELLRQHLSKRSWKGDWIAFSGVTDCYQPLEASYGITRACLDVCREFKNPVGIITKSALVRRDIDLLRKLAEVAAVQVHLSIPFADDASGRLIEPLASAPSMRFESLRVLSDAGLTTGVAIGPVIPGLNDSHIPAILERARAAGASSAFMILLRLTNDVRPIFEQRLRQAFPGRASKVMNAVDEMRAGQTSAFGQRMHGMGARWETLQGLFDVHCRRLGIDNTGEKQLEPLTRPGVKPTRQGTLFE